jgi:hypothetical protein
MEQLEEDFRKYDDPKLTIKLNLNYNPYPTKMPSYKRGLKKLIFTIFRNS